MRTDAAGKITEFLATGKVDRNTVSRLKAAFEGTGEAVPSDIGGAIDWCINQLERDITDRYHFVWGGTQCQDGYVWDMLEGEGRITLIQKRSAGGSAGFVLLHFADPRRTSGRLSQGIVTFLKIEGTHPADSANTHMLKVDTVDGEELREPVDVWVGNADLPPGGRCVIEGHEAGGWISVPKEVTQTTGAESQAPWRLHFAFLATSFKSFAPGADIDSVKLRELCDQAAHGEDLLGGCPKCWSKLNASTGKPWELKCPAGCFHVIGDIDPYRVGSSSTVSGPTWMGIW